IFFAALANPAVTLPSFRATAPPGLLAPSSSVLRITALVSAAFGPSSHLISSASRPCIADQVLSATTATPLEICTASFTPRIAFALSALKLATFPPITGHRATTACSIPGRRTSMPNSARPQVLSAASSRFIALPTMRNCFGSLSFTSLGTGSFPAASLHSKDGVRIFFRRWRKHSANLLPVALQIFGDQHRKRRQHSLPHLRFVNHQRDRIVGSDPDPRVWRKCHRLSRRRTRLKPI